MRLNTLLLKIDGVLNGWEQVKAANNITDDIIAEGKQILLEEQRKRRDKLNANK